MPSAFRKEIRWAFVSELGQISRIVFSRSCVPSSHNEFPEDNL